MLFPDATYVPPIRRQTVVPGDDLFDYVKSISAWLPVIVVDGSPAEVFERHAALFHGAAEHVPVAPDIPGTNGKVRGVLTALRAAKSDVLIIADDDVRYDKESLAAACESLVSHDVVRPQNIFDPAPWHARWDMGRSLLNRLSGGDWPGTLGVRAAAIRDGYDSNVLFENLELIRTVRAAGGTECRLDSCFVRRRPPTFAHFLSQRVRQAYDEFARPMRFALQLAILPGMLLAWFALGVRAMLALCAAIVVFAEIGRRKGGGARAFPPDTAFWAPLWVAERAVTSWCALTCRVATKGVGYGDSRLSKAANSVAVIRRRMALQGASS